MQELWFLYPPSAIRKGHLPMIRKCTLQVQYLQVPYSTSVDHIMYSCHEHEDFTYLCGGNCFVVFTACQIDYLFYPAGYKPYDHEHSQHFILSINFRVNMGWKSSIWSESISMHCLTSGFAVPFSFRSLYMCE